MTDSATEGSVEQPSAVSAGNLDAQPAADNGSTATPAPSWLEGLSEDNRKLAENKGWKSPEDIEKVFSSYSEMEKAQGASLRVPKDDAPKEEWDKFYSRLGRPDTADKYEFKRPEGLPEDLPWDSEGEKALKAWAFDAGVPPKQAQTILDGYAKMQADRLQAARNAQVEAVTKAADELTKEWGPADSEGFKQKHQLADRAFKKLGLLEGFQRSGIILADGSLTDPQIAKAFAAIGETMFADDTIGNDSSVVTDNPFKGQRNISAISNLVKTDPQKAARLAREAGEDPRNWGLK